MIGDTLTPVGEVQFGVGRGLREIDPTLRLANLARVAAPFRRPDLARFTEGLRKAGLPE